MGGNGMYMGFQEEVVEGMRILGLAYVRVFFFCECPELQQILKGTYNPKHRLFGTLSLPPGSLP